MPQTTSSASSMSSIGAQLLVRIDEIAVGRGCRVRQRQEPSGDAAVRGEHRPGEEPARLVRAAGAAPRHDLVQQRRRRRRATRPLAPSTRRTWPAFAARCQSPTDGTRASDPEAAGSPVAVRTCGDRRDVSHQRLSRSTESASPSRSRVQMSSDRYFQPPSASSTTIVPCSMVAATRWAAADHAPGRDPREDALALGQLAQRRDGLRVGDQELSVEQRRIEDLRDEAVVERAQPLDRVTGQRLGGVDLDVGAMPLQPAPDAHERAAGAQPGHEDVHLRTVGDDLLGGRPLVGQRVRGVAVLVGHHEPWVVGDQLPGQGDRAVRAQLAGRVDRSRPRTGASSWRRSWVTLSGSTTATR